MKYILSAAAVAISLSSGMAQAQSGKFAVISIKSKTQEVKVTNMVGGYDEQALVKFIAAHCAGKVSALVPKGKPRKRRGKLFQKYIGGCTGGPKQNVVQASQILVEIELIDGGKTMYEYTYSENGNIAFKRVVR